MNIPNGGAQPPTVYQPSSKVLPIALVVFGILTLLIILGVVTGINSYRKTQRSSQAAISVGNSFINNMGQHNYRAARSLLVSQLQATTPPNNLRDIEMLTEKYHGAFSNLGQPGWFVQDRGGQVTARLSYPVQFARSSSNVSLTLVQTKTGYRVYNYYYTF
jgi:hypothetical protein